MFGTETFLLLLGSSGISRNEVAIRWEFCSNSEFLKIMPPCIDLYRVTEKKEPCRHVVDSSSSWGTVGNIAVRLAVIFFVDHHQ